MSRRVKHRKITRFISYSCHANQKITLNNSEWRLIFAMNAGIHISFTTFPNFNPIFSQRMEMHQRLNFLTRSLLIAFQSNMHPFQKFNHRRNLKNRKNIIYCTLKNSVISRIVCWATFWILYQMCFFANFCIPFGIIKRLST